MYCRICAVLVSVLLLGFPGISAAESIARFDLPAQPLADALRAVGDQTNRNVFFNPKLVAGKQAPALQASLTVEKALDALLKGSGLKYELASDGTVTVRRIADREAADRQGGPADQMRMALLEDEASQKTHDAAVRDSKSQVVVQGERDRPVPFSTNNLDLTRTEDDALPFQVFDARDIALSGAPDVQEFLRNRLPQNFTAYIALEETGDLNGLGRGTANMRGWDETETVFLLNGRRMPAEYQGLSGDTNSSTPDLRGIPLASIERIEVLSSAGSAIYGAGATGGVINIITRRDFQGGQVALNYEAPQHSDAPRRNLDLSYNLPLKRGFGLRLGASYSDVEPMLAGDRADVTASRWFALGMERSPAQIIVPQSGNPLLTSTQRFGATPNIRATSTSGNLFSSITGAPASNFTSVPVGSAGAVPLSGYQPGVYNLEMGDGNTGTFLYGQDSPVGVYSDSRVLTLGLDKALGERWDWSLDARYSEISRVLRDGQSDLAFNQSGSLSSGPLVPAGAPTNPFGQNVYVLLVDPNMPVLRDSAEDVSWTVSSTLRGAIGEWHGFFDVSYSHNRNQSLNYEFLEPIGGWTAAFNSGAYNPFVDPRVAPAAAPGFYEDYTLTRSTTDSATRTYQTSLKASGPLFNLPAGSLQLTVGVEGSRVERYRNSIIPSSYLNSLTGDDASPLSPPRNINLNNPVRNFGFDSHAGYAELTAPLLAAAQNIPLVRKLELFASGRIDRMERDGFRSQLSLFGPTPEGVPVKYTHTSSIHALGLRYEMPEGIMLRVSRSIGIKPPGMTQITPDANPPTNNITGLYDPLRPDWGTTTTPTGLLAPTMYVSGGNPDLDPEGTRSTNFGLIFTPERVRGLRLSVDYLESVRDSAIFSFSASSYGVQSLINLESELPGLIQRGTPDASGVGPINFVDLRFLNLNQIASKSLDFTVEQRVENVGGGRLVFTASATKNLSFKVQVSRTAPPEEQVRNVNGIRSQQIKWNGNAQLRWEGPRWSVGWSARYFDYLLTHPQYLVFQGADRVPAELEHDLNVNYRAPNTPDPRGAQWLLSGTSFTFGVKNVFDRTPRFYAASYARGVAPYDSVVGRSLWMRVSKDFM